MFSFVQALVEEANQSDNADKENTEVRHNSEEHEHAKKQEPLLSLLDKARERRQNAEEYMKLLFRYGGALIGKKKWKTNSLTKRFSDYVTIADEAFLWLCIDTYLPVYNRVDKYNANPAVKRILMVSNQATENNKDKAKPRTASGNRYGWTTAGIQEFNKYCEAIADERTMSSNKFEDDFLEYCQTNTLPQHRPNTGPKTPPIKAWNCLAL